MGVGFSPVTFSTTVLWQEKKQHIYNILAENPDDLWYFDLVLTKYNVRKRMCAYKCVYALMCVRLLIIYCKNEGSFLGEQ